MRSHECHTSVPFRTPSRTASPPASWARGSHLHQSWIAIVGIVFGGISGLVYVVRLALNAEKDPAMQDDDSSSGDDSSAGKGSGGTGS
ncbi:MAG: hypothetical protein ABR865_07865 [Terracidiphilus sp.]